MKLVVLDTETTGLNPYKHQLVQLAGFIVIDNKIEDTFNFKVSLQEGKEIEDEALKVNKLTREIINSYESPAEVLPKIKKFFYQYVDRNKKNDTLYMVGYNVKFDEGFIKQFFTEMNAINSYNNIFDRRTIDVMSICMAYCNLKNIKTKYNQRAMAKLFEIELDESLAHEALYDCYLCYNLLMKMYQKWK